MCNLLLQEVLAGEKHSQKSIVWSLGCVVHELATKFPPFYGTKTSELMSNITNFTRIKLTNYSRELQGIVDVMLETNPLARPTLQELHRHPVVVSRLRIREASRTSVDKENTGGKTKKQRGRDCNNCIHLELELNKIKHKEAALNLKECRLKERELSLARRENKVSQLEYLRKSSAAPHRRWEGDVLEESTVSGDVSDVLTITSTKLNPLQIKKPNFVKKNVHFTDLLNWNHSMKRMTDHHFDTDNQPVSATAKDVPDGQKVKNAELLQAVIAYPSNICEKNSKSFLETHFL